MKTLSFLSLCLIILQGCTKTDDTINVNDDFSIYLTKDSLVKTILDLNNVVPDKPLINYNDIVSYDTAKNIIELNHKIDTIFDYKNHFDGRGFVALLNKKTKVYCGVLWSPIHSIPNPNIVITLPMDNISNDRRLVIIEGYPNPTFYKGTLKIRDKRIIELLKKDKKIK